MRPLFTGENSRVYLLETHAQFEHELSIETTSKKREAGIDGKTSENEERYGRKIEDLETTLRTPGQSAQPDSRAQLTAGQGRCVN